MIQLLLPRGHALLRFVRPSWGILSSRPSSTARVSLVQLDAIHSVDERYLSFSIDISVLAGGNWWEGSKTTHRGLGTKRIPPLNLNHPKLDALTQHLQPAYLRVGGSEADKIHYFQSSAPSDDLVLSEDQWNALHAFVKRNQLKFAFTFKYGLFKRKWHGQWQANEVERLLDHAKTHQHCLDVCELGNELNAYWAFHGIAAQPRAKHLATDYHAFARAIAKKHPNAKIIGPGSAFWPKLGETIRPLSNITQKFLRHCQAQGTPLDIIDWHYYPFQSFRAPVRTRTARLRSFLKPSALNDFMRYATHIRTLRDRYYPTAKLWVGESGSAQCGGEPELSDRFVSCFWWADQLGLGARAQHHVMIRQSLIGGDYGLIDRLKIKPRPDYWVSWLWKRLMGRAVFEVQSPHHMLRAYCHSSAQGVGKTLLLINLSGKPLTIQTEGFGSVKQQYALTAKHLQSKRIRINGIRAKFKKGEVNLQSFETPFVHTYIQGHSINFWCLEP